MEGTGGHAGTRSTHLAFFSHICRCELVCMAITFGLLEMEASFCKTDCIEFIFTISGSNLSTNFISGRVKVKQVQQ